jgi:hypothetical protein
MPTSKTRQQPATLQAQAEEQANQAHARRLAEIKALAPLLASLETLLPALTTRGLQVYPSQLSLEKERDAAGRQQSQLRLRTDAMFSGERPAKWLDALAALGFTEVSRSTYCVTVRRGRLVLVVDKPTQAEERARSATIYATRVAQESGPAAQQHLVETVLAQPWADSSHIHIGRAAGMPRDLQVTDDFGNVVQVGQRRYFCMAPFGFHHGGVLSLMDNLAAVV